MGKQLVLITGASSGIGQALARRYVQAGWQVAMVARRVEMVQEWVRQQGWSEQEAQAYAADVTDWDGMVQMAQLCMARQGVPEVLIANAGISIGMDTSERSDLDVMRQVFETNNLGMAASFHPFVEAMKAQGRGTLVGIASVAGIRGLPGHGAYCASKSAVIAYCESLRGELRGTGVQVVTLLPGYIDTPLTQKNRYSMPFLMQVDAFADAAFRAISRGCTYTVIPWQMGIVAKLLRILPNALFDRLLSGRPRKQRAATEQAKGR